VEFTAAPPRSRSFRRRFSPNSPSIRSNDAGGPGWAQGAVETCRWSWWF
jgi:hypothetical protein